MEINFKKLSILFLTFSIMGLICLGAVSAHNVSVGDCSTDKKLSGVVLSSDLSVRDVSNSSIGASEENLNNVVDDYYSSNASSFKELQNDLNTYSKVKLTRNVTLNDNEYDSVKEGMIIDNDKWIDGNGYTIDACKKTRIFKANNCNLYLNNLNLINGHFDKNVVCDNDGGAVWSDGFVSCNNCNFTNNYAGDYGGAIFAKDVSVKDSYFKDNSASDNDGGAIYSKNTVYVDNSSFVKNTAKEDGGAIYAKSNVTVKDSYFENNSASGAHVCQCKGGAIYSGGSLVAFCSKFISNHAHDYGGAIWVHDNCTINTCLFKNNVAQDNDGGAVYMHSHCLMEIRFSAFYGNSAHDYGGALYCDSTASRLSVYDNAFENNTCGKEGSVAFSYGFFNEYGWRYGYDIGGNWWGTKNPNWKSNNGLLVEHVYVPFTDNPTHSDPDPLDHNPFIDYNPFN